MAQATEELHIVVPRAEPHHPESITSSQPITVEVYSDINSSSPSDKSKYATNRAYLPHHAKSATDGKKITIVVAVLVLIALSLLACMLYKWIYNPEPLESPNNFGQTVAISNKSASVEVRPYILSLSRTVHEF